MKKHESFPDYHLLLRHLVMNEIVILKKAMSSTEELKVMI